MTSDASVRVSKDLDLPAAGVGAVLDLLDGGATVPFIARYRKEATGGLDEVQIRAIQERHAYVAELEARRAAILAAIDSQGQLAPELRARLLAAPTKAELEDLYLPFKPKRRTRATMARERGLEPLAMRILEQPVRGDPVAEAAAFVDPERGVADAEAALAGARDIAAEVLSERAEVRAHVRQAYFERGRLASEVAPDRRAERTKFEQYYDFGEPVRTIPSHRYLAIRRGEEEGVLRVRLEVDAEALLAELGRLVGVRAGTPFGEALDAALRDGYKRLLAPSVETEVRVELKARSDREAVAIFAENLRHLLLAAPLGTRAVVGIDPGQRTGCKCAALDATGKFLDHLTIFLTSGEAAADRAERDFVAFVRKHRPDAVAVGNGTGGRETYAFVREALGRAAMSQLPVVQVSEAGASVYSASDVAREEFPDLDLTIRGAISIGRRLQDPLAELVKIEPKAIGVGQYQHDVHQPLLGQKLEEVVESCVNHVGVEVNTASAPLLRYVAGIGPATAKKVVAHREERGLFSSRQQLLDVTGLGPRTFEQCAGFLRIRGGANPLDASAVHPERYELVASMAADLGVALADLVGNPSLTRRIDVTRYLGGGVGEPTLLDIVRELEKPGRDPRDAFEPPRFRDDVHTLEDLRVGMTLEGVVTNVTAFGAFVDVGVHQDGLVHVSQLADRFVRHPSEVVVVGDRLRVRVLEVDLERRRISLSARSGAPATEGGPEPAAAQTGAEPAKRGAGRDAVARPAASARGGERQKPGFSNSPFAGLRGGKPRQ